MFNPVKVPPITDYRTIDGVCYALFGSKDLTIVGVNFPNPEGEPTRQAVIGALQPDNLTRLVREPDNEHHSNAVAIYAHGKAGYLPRPVADALAPLMDLEPTWQPLGIVMGFYGSETKKGLKIRVADEKGEAERLVAKYPPHSSEMTQGASVAPMS